ncbi:uncharacterized protein LOC122510587 [Leptopilina heterotoma]|uniref:uncharacterized protein LOC122510587 n=1 Tax=Leptopilina heterotoma TaxID=63436 RepID=UPI001CA8D170|nr:uncharacterized protein LOC122510587 [Leptopilina heterotoma]
MVSVPSVQTIEFVSRNTKNKGITYEELKLLLMQDEATRCEKEEEKEIRAVNMVTGEVNKRCYECQDYGHIGAYCPKKGKGKMCYRCNKFGNHIANNCPTTNNQPEHSYRGRGYGRGDPRETNEEIIEKSPEENLNNSVTKDEENKTNKAPYEQSNFDVTIWDRKLHDIDELSIIELPEEESLLLNNKNE